MLTWQVPETAFSEEKCMQNLLSRGKLLNDNGELIEKGYATSLVREYSREDIKASALRIKEWDYYLIYNQHFALALTIDANAYMSMLSVSVIDFDTPAETTISPIGLFPMGKLNMPPTSAEGISRLRIGNSELCFTVGNGERRLSGSLAKSKNCENFDCDIVLFDEPADSMVIATPFANKPRAFYYNQKIIAMRASGRMNFNGKEYSFDPAVSFGLLDWGRGVWTYRNTWYWGAAQGMADGHTVGFNIGYGFGDTSAASENMLFYDGKAHKINDVAFNIPKTEDGRDDFMSPWAFTSSDRRFEMDFVPVIDRKAKTDLLLIGSDQHQVFGRFSGRMRLNNGEVVEIRDFLGFAEKVKNKW